MCPTNDPQGERIYANRGQDIYSHTLLVVLVSDSKHVVGFRDRMGQEIHLAWTRLEEARQFLQRLNDRGLLSRVRRLLPLTLAELKKLLTRLSKAQPFQVLIDPSAELEASMVWDSSDFN
jgi:hypothetical protein